MKRRSIKTLLSQGAAGGICASYLMICVQILSYPNPYNFLFAGLLPISLLFGAMTGAVGGAVIWMLERLVKRNWTIATRIAISALFMMLLFVLLNFVSETNKSRFLFQCASLAAFGLSIGVLTGSNARPWRLIARGTKAGPSLRVLFRRGPIRISQTIEELGLTGLPLRAASLFALMVSWLLATCNLSFLWWGEASFRTFEEFTENLLTTAYFGLTVAVSFTVWRKLPVLIIAALLNVLWTMWMLKTDLPNPNPFVALLVCIFIVLWLLFISGIVFSVKGELQVEYGGTEIRFGKQQWVKESQ